MTASTKRPFSREQRAIIVYGMLFFVLIVVVLQLWLLTATMNAFLGGDPLFLTILLSALQLDSHIRTHMTGACWSA